MKLNQKFLCCICLFLTASTASDGNAQPPKAQDKQPNQQVLIDGEHIELNGKQAFIEEPKSDQTHAIGKPWVFYAATRPNFPDKAETEMHRQLLAAGIAIAGIDVGEAYGSPKAFPHFESLYQEMLKRGYADKPVLLGRSRGGLWVSSWAIKHPDRVKAIACIYPAFDFTTYPNLKRAAPAYGLSEQELTDQQNELNPIRRCDVLAKHRIPVFIIHGVDDDVVPIRENSDKLVEIYSQNEAAKAITLMRIKGQGHNYWPGFFQCKELIQFVIAQSQKSISGSESDDGKGTGVVTTWLDDATAAASLTIDDNIRPDHEWWLATGKKYNVKFTWFVISGWVEKNAAQFGTWDDFKALRAAGHDIQSHTVDHLPNFPESGPLTMAVNYGQSIKDIEAKLADTDVLTLAYPMGLKPPNDSKLAAKHYIAARGVTGTLNKLDSIDFFNVNSLSTDGYRGGFPIPGVVEPKHWAYLPNLVTPKNQYYGGWLSVHSHGLKDRSKEAMTKLLDYLTSKPGDFWIAPFTNVAQYAQQRAASKLEVSTTSPNEIRFVLTDSLDDAKFYQLLTVKIKVAKNWKSAIATQHDTELPVTFVEEAGVNFALVNSVPDKGEVVIKLNSANARQ